QPEIRLAVAEPGLDIGNVETALESLTEACYYLAVERNRYRFSLKENLNKRFADRRATIQSKAVDEYVREEIQKVFSVGAAVVRTFFREKTGQVPDRPAVARYSFTRQFAAGKSDNDQICRDDPSRLWVIKPHVQKRPCFLRPGIGRCSPR